MFTGGGWSEFGVVGGVAGEGGPVLEDFLVAIEGGLEFGWVVGLGEGGRGEQQR